MSWIYPQSNSGFTRASIIFMIAIHSLDTSCTSSLSDCQASITVSIIYLLICSLMNRPEDILYILQWHTSLAAKWCSRAYKFWWDAGLWRQSSVCSHTSLSSGCMWKRRDSEKGCKRSGSCPWSNTFNK